jgi:hypothetical protein
MAVDWEQDWLRSNMPVHLFARAGRMGIARSAAGRRRLRLLACASCRCGWDLFDASARAAIETAERFADGQATATELDAANAVAAQMLTKLGLALPYPNDSSYRLLREKTGHLERALFWVTSQRNARRLAENTCVEMIAVCPAARAAEAALIHCLLGNPYRHMKLPSAVLSWNGGTVDNMARTIDEERRFADLKILADALEEAGCTDAVLLAHCRGRGPHAHGCHVLEAILGRPQPLVRASD